MPASEPFQTPPPGATLAIIYQELLATQQQLALVEEERNQLRVRIHELKHKVSVLEPVGHLYLDAFSEDDGLTLAEALRLTEVRKVLASDAAAQQPS